MGIYNGTADRKAQSRAAGVALVTAALEFLEQPLRITRRQAGPVVIDNNAYRVSLKAGRDADLRPRRRVFDAVLEQIGEDLRDEQRIDVDRRQVTGQIDPDNVLRQPVVQLPERQAPSRSSIVCQSRRSLHLTGLKTHQVKHVGDELGHLLRFGSIDAASRARAAVSSSELGIVQRAARPGDHG